MTWGQAPVARATPRPHLLLVTGHGSPHSTMACRFVRSGSVLVAGMRATIRPDDPETKAYGKVVVSDTATDTSLSAR